MNFLISDTFTESLARLTGDEQKAVKTTAFELQLNPASPGHHFHKLDRARDKNFWSVRAGSNIRLIVHKTPGSLLLCYADHHDKAYAWAERRKLETHPNTGAAQLVEIRETVQEILVPRYVPEAEKPKKKPLLFSSLNDEELLQYGVPEEWLGDVKAANEDSLLLLAERLPAEASEALLELATGGKPQSKSPATPPTDPFEHPDAKRRFRVVSDVEELARALEYPWDKWTIFLHPDQRDLVERSYSGPFRVSGSAGTGKTIVALHRAVHLAKAHPNERVLLVTFSKTLANALQIRLRRLISNAPRLGERIDVHSMEEIGLRLYLLYFGESQVASAEKLKEILVKAANEVEGHKFSLQFLFSEWDQVVDAWHIESWEGYRDVARLGRKTRLPEPQRAKLWSIFEKVQQELKSQKMITQATMFTALGMKISEKGDSPFGFIVVDEAQDISIPQLRFISALGRNRAEALFFAGDIGQRIFQQPFSWLSLGLDIRGRSRTLKVNYRTSHQIRAQADRLLAPVVTDVDGVTEKRSDTVSVFNGPAPEVQRFKTEDEEISAVAEWIKRRTGEGLVPHEIAIFVRSPAQTHRAIKAAAASQCTYKVLDDKVETKSGCISISTMHLAKGLEFRAVVVMGCDDEVIPLQERIQKVGDDADLLEVYETERHLLYVACTRARDHLLVTAVEPASEFLDDLR